MFKIVNKLKNKKGFTLVELIVVLAVLLIIAAIAVPRYLAVQEAAKADADEATLAGIQKAAELYYAATSDSTPTIAEMATANYFEAGQKFTNGDTINDTEITFTVVTATGKVTAARN